jgi:hypothetical protein
MSRKRARGAIFRAKDLVGSIQLTVGALPESIAAKSRRSRSAVNDVRTVFSACEASIGFGLDWRVRDRSGAMLGQFVVVERRVVSVVVEPFWEGE